MPTRRRYPLKRQFYNHSLSQPSETELLASDVLVAYKVQEGQKISTFYSPALQRKVAISVSITAGKRGMR